MNRLPLHGIRVLDFSTLLPGPYATLMLAETTPPLGTTGEVTWLATTE